MAEASGPVLHVVVVGFHHKKGCQVEYSYPPLVEGNAVDSHEVPEKWKHLASLALPDGAHNYDKDTIFFHLPSLNGTLATVYGVSCYRQIDAKDLKNRTADVTRSTVQKSVCVLSRLPLYGLIQAKLELITHAYFDEKDFSQVALLEDTHKNLNASLTESLLQGTQVFLGLPCRDVIQHFKHKILVLFKLMLLERKVLFFASPVKSLCSTMLTVLSLFPGMIESGLKECAFYSPHKQLSPTLKVTQASSDSEDYLEVQYKDVGQSSLESSLETGTSNIAGSCKLVEGQLDAGLVDNDTASTTIAGAAVKALGVDNTGEINGKNRTKGNDASSERNSNTACAAESAAQKDVKPGMSMPKQTKNRHNLENKLRQAVDIECITHVQAIQEGESQQADALPSNSTPSKDPLEHVECITHLESVQTPHKGSVGSRGSGPCEDLDSPASLQQIDAEDSCFSWEEDKLLLEIDDELETDIGDKGVGPQVREVSTSASDKTRDNQAEPSNAGAEAETVSKTSWFINEPLTSVSLDSDTEDQEKDEKKRTHPEESPNNKDKEHGSITRSDSHSSISSRSSDRSVASNLSAKAVILKQKLTLAWTDFRDKDGKNKFELQDLGPMSPNTLPVDEVGFPLAIFTKGSLCHPYLSLQYYDLLQDVNVRSFVIGATNILFKQKKHLTDAVIEVLECKVDLHDQELRKQLNLTTADLRFADLLVKGVSDEKGDIFLDDTGWEGGDDWLRGQFALYLKCLMKTTLEDDEKLLEDFNPSFVTAWKTTHNYKVWKCGPGPKTDAIQQILPGHPCQGQLSMSDMKLKISHNLQSTERGKKLNAAVAQTGKVMVQTGKAVGGALTSAKSAVSSWFSSVVQDWRQTDRGDEPQEKTVDDKNL